MQMTVLNVAYPLAAVGPDAVGGAEQVLAAIEAAVVDAGHRSLVIASADSTVRGELIPLPVIRRPFDAGTVQVARDECRRAICRALCERPIDLVHLHGIDFPEYLPPPGTPVLATLHLPVSWYPPEIFCCARPATFLHCVSQSQHAGCPPCEYLLPPIPNGVDMPPPRRVEQRRYALALGRICPEKGFHLALDAATRAGIPLLLAGRVFPYEAHVAYFREQVQPRLRALHTYVGPAGREAKTELYANARCLLVASTAAETSSLVALEALACGTPVIAFRNGALPEIVADGRTGFLVDDVDQMASAMRRAPEIDPEECRRVVRARFSRAAMTARYLEVYRECCRRAAAGSFRAA